MSTIRAQATMTTSRENLDEVVDIFRIFIQGVVDNDPGTLAYNYFVDDGDPVTIHILEEYADAHAHLDHYTKLDNAAVSRLLELVKLGTPHYFGDPSPEERELLAGFGEVQFHAPLIGLGDITSS